MMPYTDIESGSGMDELYFTRGAKRQKLAPHSTSRKQASRTDVCASMIDLHNDATGSEVAVNKGNSMSMLLKLPPEIKQKIWIMVITEDAPICPTQLKERSNKFLWSQSQVSDYGNRIWAAPQLAAVQLAKVCRTLYEEVALTNLLYQYNTFDLSEQSPLDVITYLVAITDVRLKLIRSMKIQLWPYYRPNQKDLFTLLQTCDGIQTLELSVGYYHTYDYRRAMEQMSAIKFLTTVLQKSKHFAVTPSRRSTMVLCVRIPYDYCMVIKQYLQELLPLSHDTKFSMEKIIYAKQVASLDVHGEGRLSEDRKPGFISSRTRQSVKLSQAMTSDGRIPPRAIAKYDSDGLLNRNVCDILDVREVESEDGSSQLEFLVKSQPYWHHRWTDSDKNSQASWEVASNLKAFENRIAIIDYYKTHLNAVGLSTVQSMWRGRSSAYGYFREISKLVQMKRTVEGRENA